MPNGLGFYTGIMMTLNKKKEVKKIVMLLLDRR